MAPLLARIILAAVLKDRAEIPGVITSGDMAETLADSLDIPGVVDRLTDNDYRASRNAVRIFERIGDEAAERLIELFRHEREALAEAERDEVLHAAKAVLNRRALPLLVQTNLVLTDFSRALRREAPPLPLTAAQQALYERLLQTAAQLVYAVADRVPDFTRETTARLLQNEDRLLDDMQAVLVNQAQILSETYGQQQDQSAQTFEAEYRTLLAAELDRLQLFGVALIDGARQPLSVAFVKMSISMIKPARDAEAMQPYRRRHETEESFNTEEALAQHPRLLVVAGAGLGKTTLLRWAAVQAAQHRGDNGAAWRKRLPFFVQLRDFAQRPLPATADLAHAAPGSDLLAGSAPDQWALHQIRRGRALIFLDGMDEVSDAKRHEAFAWLERLLLLAPDLPVVVSGRPSALENAETQAWFQAMNFWRADLQPLDEARIDEFIGQWHIAMADERCRYADKARLPAKERQLRQAMIRPQLQSLAHTPLLCAMLCALNLTESGELPPGSRSTLQPLYRHAAQPGRSPPCGYKRLHRPSAARNHTPSIGTPGLLDDGV